MTSASETITMVGRRQVKLTNQQKPLYPSGFTKGEVVAYYRLIAPVMLPYLKDRAVTLKRYPNGTDHPFFFEKNCTAHRPDWIKTALVPGEEEGTGNHHCVMADQASLVWAANLAALELHVPLGKVSAQARPTVMVFDLDPGPPAALLDCVELAMDLRGMLDDVGLKCHVKTSGNKGLHLYVPLNTPAVAFEQTKDFARAVARIFERRHPDRVTTSMSKAQRTGKVFVDWSQNDQHKTTACAYTLRATAAPQVSTPLMWEELQSFLRSPNVKKLTFSPDQVLQRVEKWGDLFEPVLRQKQRLPRMET